MPRLISTALRNKSWMIFGFGLVLFLLGLGLGLKEMSAVAGSILFILGIVVLGFAISRGDVETVPPPPSPKPARKATAQAEGEAPDWQI